MGWGDGKSDPASVKGEVNILPERFDPDLRDRFTGFYRKALSRDFRARFDNPGEMLKMWNGIFENVDERKTTKTTHPETDETEGMDVFELPQHVTPATQLLILGLSTRLRLCQIAVAASGTAALSSRMEIYAVGLTPERALMISQNALFGGALTVEEIQSRVAARLPRAKPLPGRPELDNLIDSLGLEMKWKPAAASGRGAYEMAGGEGFLTEFGQHPSNTLTSRMVTRCPSDKLGGGVLIKYLAKTSILDILALFFMDLGQQNLEEALRLLGNLLAARKGAGFWLVVCGGSALLAQEIITCSTEDVDILAMRDWEGGVDRAYPLPEVLKEAATHVADELHLGGNWLNSAASMRFPDLHLLPASFWQELETRDYGDYLKISFVTRSGQIQLKTYAALNSAKPRDLDDLRTLAPDSAETEVAVRWVLDNIPVLSHRDKLPDLLTHLDHAHLIPAFQG